MDEGPALSLCGVPSKIQSKLPPENNSSKVSKPFQPRPGEPSLKMSASKVKKPDVLRVTDFRRELTFREKKVAEIKREKMKVLADIKPVPKFMITVDMSHARGNLDAVRMCLRELEWKEFPFGRKDQHCDIHWHCMNFEQNPDLYAGKVNKFPGMSWICSKNNLFRVLDQMHALYPDEYDFYPRTWYLPAQLPELAHDIRRLNEKHVKPRPTFIVKPDAGSQGEGIYLIRDERDYHIVAGRSHVCQEYLGDVFLMDKFKFDLRVYAVLTSTDPLELYICKEGLARFSTVPYETPTQKNLHEAFMHLTNYSLNKKSATFNRSEREDEGSKRTITSVFNRMRRHGYNVDKVWRRIEQIIVKTMIAIIPDLKIEMMNAVPANKPGPTCFQILGFDILLLSNLKPVLLEINGSPSLGIDSEVEVMPGVPEYVPSPKDEEVKIPLIRDTLLLVAPYKKMKYLERLKRRRRRYARKQRLREEEKQRQMEEDEKRPPLQHERDGVIHVETNHPRSSIIIIRSTDDEDPPKRPNRESSFTLPSSFRTSNVRKVDENENDLGVNITEGSKMECSETGDGDDAMEHQNCVENGSRARSTQRGSNNTSNYRSRSSKDRNNMSEKADSKSAHNITENNQSQNHLHPSQYHSNKSDNRGCRGENVNGYEEYDERMYESSNSEEERPESGVYESCLRLVYPGPYAKKYERFRLYEKLADVFIVSLGVRATQRLGPTGFRTFARKCQLSKRGLNNASIDILFINMQRKWEHVNPERTQGLSFRGFLDACHEIARRKFQNGDTLITMHDFIDYCQENLQEDQLYQARFNPRLLTRRARPHGYPLLEPMVASLQSHSPVILEEHMGLLPDNRHLSNSSNGRYHRPTSTDDVSLFLQKHKHLNSIKSTSSGRRSKSRSKEIDET